MVRFGLLGTGHWAAMTHVPGLLGHPEVDLIGIWGRNPAKTAVVADEFGVRAYRELDDLLADVEAVSIAVPPDVQAVLALHAATAGRHLLLEKPLTLSVAAADQITAEVDRRELASLIFLTRRYQPATSAFIANAARTGTWHGARVVHVSSIIGSRNPYADTRWRREKGGLWDVGPHALALLLPILGPVESVVAVTAPYGTHHVVLSHDSGAVSTMALSIGMPQAAAEWSACFIGPNGPLAVPREDVRSAANALRIAASRLIANIRGGVRADPLDAHTGRHIVAILQAAEESAGHGTAVRV